MVGCSANACTIQRRTFMAGIGLSHTGISLSLTPHYSLLGFCREVGKLGYPIYNFMILITLASHKPCINLG